MMCRITLNLRSNFYSEALNNPNIQFPTRNPKFSTGVGHHAPEQLTGSSFSRKYTSGADYYHEDRQVDIVEEGYQLQDLGSGGKS